MAARAFQGETIGSYGSVSYSSTTGGGGASTTSAPIIYNAEKPNGDPLQVKAFVDCFSLLVPDAGASYSVGLLVTVPEPNDPSALFDPSTAMVGHTFIQLTKTSGTASVTQYIGFDPTSPAWSFVMLSANVGSEMVDNGGHIYNASYTLTVNEQQFYNVINTMIANSGLAYNLFGYNCTNFALQAFNAALTVPLNPLPSAIPGTAGNVTAITPNGVYSLLQQMKNDAPSSSSIKILNTNATAGSSKGACN